MPGNAPENGPENGPGVRLEVADVLRRYGDAYRLARVGHLGRVERRVMSAIVACRTAALGGHVEACDDCGVARVAYNSCRNRHCPKCQGAARAQWLVARQAELLPVPYFHVVFTLPAPIAAVAFQNKAAVYAILFAAAAEAMTTLASNPRRLGAQIGAVAVLHTWGQTLTHHPHIHCVVPGGGLSRDGTRWIAGRPDFFLAVKPLAKLYRRLFLERLQKAYDAGALRFFGDLANLTDPQNFLALVAGMRGANWVVYAKKPFGGLRAAAPFAIVSAMPAANVLAIFTARLVAPTARVIITHHSPVDTHNPVLNFADGWLGTWRNVSKIVCVSNVVSASLAGKPRSYIAKRSTIYNALSPRLEELLSRLASRRDRSRAITRTILAAGRLTWVKNYPVLLRAAAHVPNVEVQIIGGGEDEQQLMNLARDLGVETRVRFLGRRSREETLRLLAAGDVFVQPSLSEGHSLALIEAAKLHLPLIVSNVPAQIEGVTAKDGTRCGILIDPNDHDALALEICRLLDDSHYYVEWVKRSAHLAESNGFDAMIDAYVDVLRDPDRNNRANSPAKISKSVSV